MVTGGEVVAKGVHRGHYSAFEVARGGSIDVFDVRGGKAVFTPREQRVMSALLDEPDLLAAVLRLSGVSNGE